MRLKIVSIFTVALLLAACETPSDQSAGSAGGGSTSSTSSGSGTSSATTIPGPTPGSQEHLLVNVGDRVFFDFDKSDLQPEGRATSEKVAVWLNSYPTALVTVEGHADERGTREYNLALGERRANSVRDYLIALGVDPNRITTISYGKERPAVLGSNEDAWAQNRRGIFAVN